MPESSDNQSRLSLRGSWARLEPSTQRFIRILITAALALFMMGVVQAVLLELRNVRLIEPLHTLVDSLYGNVFSEALSITLTVLILDQIYERREDRKRAEDQAEAAELQRALVKSAQDYIDEAMAQQRRIQQEERRQQLIDQMSSKIEGLPAEAIRLLKDHDRHLPEDAPAEDHWWDDQLVVETVGRDGNLTLADLTGAKLEDKKLLGANFERAKLSRANLRLADLSDAHLSFAELLRTNLELANLSGAYMEKSNLSTSNLEGTKLLRTRLEDAKLIGTYLEGANASGAYLKGADLSGAHLENINLLEANLENANLSGANLTGAQLLRADLRKAKLSGAYLTNAILSEAMLTNASLFEAHLEYTELFRAELSNANLFLAHLEHAQLWNAHLKHAHLRGAHLDGVEFAQATLEDADFTFASLKSAKHLTIEMLQSCASLEGTILPDGTKLPGLSYGSIGIRSDWRTPFEEWCKTVPVDENGYIIPAPLDDEAE